MCEKPTLCSIFNNHDCDIIWLQETWFSKQDLEVLSSLHPEFHGTGVATIDYRDKLYKGHPSGRVAIMWRSNLDEFGTPLKFEDLIGLLE